MDFFAVFDRLIFFAFLASYEPLDLFAFWTYSDLCFFRILGFIWSCAFFSFFFLDRLGALDYLVIFESFRQVDFLPLFFWTCLDLCIFSNF